MSFEARYWSTCLACDRRISPGDSVKWADDNVVHENCVFVGTDFRPIRPVCPKCFLEPAASGVCGCDE